MNRKSIFFIKLHIQNDKKPNCTGFLVIYVIQKAINDQWLALNGKFQQNRYNIQNLSNQSFPKVDHMNKDNHNEYTQILISTHQSQIMNPVNKNNYQMDLVSQFLQIKRLQVNNQTQTLKLKDQKPEETDQISRSINQSLQKSQNSSQTKKTRSIFQNFQKHLITTLKTSISITKSSKNDSTIHLAHRMWKTFLNTNYFSKKILYFLFGVKTEIQNSIQTDIYPSFNEIATLYPIEQIVLAQQYLRIEVARQGRKVINRNILCNRRMRKSEQFLTYFQNFIDEIQDGKISRRLPKSSKINLMKSLNTKESL